MKIAFNPSTVAALTAPPNNKDITFDLRGRNIFARGVKFYGTDTNTWRPVVDNLTSNSTTSSLSANQGRVLKTLIDGKSDSGHNHDGRYVKKTGDTMSGALNFANGTWNKVGDDSYVGDCNINGHFGIKAANTTYPGITFFDNSSARLGSLTAYSGNIKYGAYSLQFLDNGSTSVNASTWVNPFSAYDKDAVKDGQAVCVWGQGSYLSNLSSDSGNIALYLKRINANAATLNMILDGEYYAHGNQRLAHISEIPSSLKNPHALTISLNGTSQGPYDGSVAKNINITPGSIGAATSGHNHDGRYVYNYGGIQMDGASVNKNALGMSTTSGITGDWWHILQAAWNGEYRWNSQIAFPTQNRNGMYYRSGLDDNTKWGSWIKLLDIGNSYVKDGKGIINGTTITQVDNADKLDGYHASYSSSTPWGTIPVITTQGFMDIGKHLEFHHDNTTGSDYSTILMCTGNYSNIVDLPSESGTLALLSQVVSTSNFNWTNLPGKVVAGNEFNIVNAGYNNTLAINYLPIDNRNGSATITQYNIYNGNKGLASVYAYRFKADGKSCMWKDARNYAPFQATFNGGFEPILDIRTVSGDWSIGSYDSVGNYLIFSFTSDSDFNAGVNGTAWYYITTDGTFSGASRYINHTPGEPQSYMYSTSTETYGGAIQIREVNGVLNNQSAWGYAPRITFHWGRRYAKGFGMRSDGQFAVDDVPIALTSNVLTFDNNNANYLGASFNNPDFSKKAASTYIECWDGAGGWWNWRAGKFMKAGSSDAYVLLGGGGHKPLSEFSLNSSDYDNRYLKLTGGTMNGNARIGHGSGNLYIGNSGNDGWIYTQDIASQSGTDKWWVRESGAAHFGNVYICAKSDYTTYDSSIIECYNDALYLNYYSSTKVILCKGGGSVGIGTVPSYKLDVKGQAQAQGFRHSNHNSDDAVLLAGGGYSVGCIIKYWAIYSIQLRSTTVNFSKMSGNHSFISTMSWEKTGSAILEIKYPSGFSESSTMIFGNGDHRGYYYDAPVYVTISKNYGNNDKLRITLANDTSLDEGDAYLYFLCMG